MPDDNLTQLLAEARRKAKQFLLDPDFSPAQKVVEEEVLPAINKAQQVHGGGDQGSKKASNPRVQSRRRSHSPTKSDGGMRNARKKALKSMRAKG